MYALACSSSHVCICVLSSTAVLHACLHALLSHAVGMKMEEKNEGK